MEPTSVVTITDYENFEDIHFNKDWFNNDDWNFTVDDISSQVSVTKESGKTFLNVTTDTHNKSDVVTINNGEFDILSAAVEIDQQHNSMS